MVRHSEGQAIPHLAQLLPHRSERDTVGNRPHNWKSQQVMRNIRLNTRLRVTYALESFLFEHPRVGRPLIQRKRGTRVSAFARYIQRRVEADHRLAFRIRRRRLSNHLRSLYATTDHVSFAASGTSTTNTKRV